MATTMANESLKTIDDYENFLSETLDSWSPHQRVALAAAMAERWLPAYQAFSDEAEWGDPSSLRRMLDAIWAHAAGRALKPADRGRYAVQLRDVTPHMDDFEAPEALAACMVLSDALDSCESNDNVFVTVRAALSGFEAAVPDWVFDPDDQPRLFRQVAARKELKKQLKVVEQVASIKSCDEQSIEALRSGLTAADLIGEASPPAEAKQCSAGLTNQAAFEQYRRLLEHQLKRPPFAVDAGNAYLFGIAVFSEWSSRYLARLRTIKGMNGALADLAAQQALVARQRTLDAAERAIPDWDPELAEILRLCVANALTEYDVRSLEEPHGYGPSLRRLWAESQRRGESNSQVWKSIVTWARHRPAAWEAEDRRKKKGLAIAEALGRHLARQVSWASTDEMNYPWAAQVDGQLWRVRLNDFPDDLMYALVINDAEIGAFHDWPETWVR